MKHKSLVLFAILTVVLILASFVVGRASATTGCFSDTNGHWAEVAICWMADNGITSGIGGGLYAPEGKVTRAQMAVFMKKLDELAVTQVNNNINNALSSGTTFEMSGLNNWHGNGSSGSYVQYYTNAVVLRAPAAGTYGFQITPDIPGSLFNHQMYLKGVKLCYDSDQGATLTYLALEQWENEADLYNYVLNTTNPAGKVCQDYLFDAPSDLIASDHVVLYIEASFPSAADQLWVTSTSFILAPSDNPGSLKFKASRDPRSREGRPAPAGSIPDN